MFQNQQHFKDTQIEAELKEAWYVERTLLDIFQDDPKDVLAFIKECDAADLHQFDTVHGVEQEVEIFRAILSHPKCDRATALNIFAACDPVFFERKLKAGVGYDAIEDEEDQVFFQILKIAHTRLAQRESWRGRFSVTPGKEWVMSHPKTFEHFNLSAATLRPTQNQLAISNIIYEYSVIGLTFEAWKRRH